MQRELWGTTGDRRAEEGPGALKSPQEAPATSQGSPSGLTGGAPAAKAALQDWGALGTPGLNWGSMGHVETSGTSLGHSGQGSRVPEVSEEGHVGWRGLGRAGAGGAPGSGGLAVTELCGFRGEGQGLLGTGQAAWDTADPPTQGQGPPRPGLQPTSES